ncbi:MAG TPA: DUF1697 domain-containing protein [Puia sp.]|nr:DUF1697 domain-containing protein [Puia sp.]
MSIYISILRGINVSGSKMIKMDTLKKIYEDAGFKNAQTYIQSGNVVFQSKKSSHAALEEKIAEAILKSTKFEVPVLVKDPDELKEVFNKNPFLLKRKEDINFLHVTFLSDIPTKENIERIKGEYAPDEFVISGKNIYLFCPNGYGKTKLHNNFFESKLKLSATTRNWKTIAELINITEHSI